MMEEVILMTSYYMNFFETMSPLYRPISRLSESGVQGYESTGSMPSREVWVGGGVAPPSQKIFQFLVL